MFAKSRGLSHVLNICLRHFYDINFVFSLKVWGMVLLNQENRLLTGSADSELRAWDIQDIEEVKRYLLCCVGGILSGTVLSAIFGFM